MIFMVQLIQTFNGRKLGITNPMFENPEKQMLPVMISSASKIAKVVEQASKQDYMNKRKSKNSGSFVFGSFVVEPGKATGAKEVRAIVFAGGQEAPHAVYVDQDRVLRNGKMWSEVNSKAPYMFMLSGLNVGKEQSLRILKEEFSKKR